MKAIIERSGKDYVVTTQHDGLLFAGRRLEVSKTESGRILIHVYDTSWDRWKRGGILAQPRDHRLVVDEVEGL